jgi:hypothetical protein
VGAKVLVEREEGNFGGGGWPIFRFPAGSTANFTLFVSSSSFIAAA